MAERQFRFRLPWLTAAAPAPRPTTEPQPPPPITEIQAPPRPITTVSIQRPPFRPAGIAPAQPPPPPPPLPQVPQRTEPEPQPLSPPRATNQTRAASVPPSPSRATTQTRATSVPPSPTRATTETRIAPEPSSPTRAAIESGIAPQPSSPSRAATQTRPASQTQSPSRAAPQLRAASVPPSPSRTTSQKPQAALQMPMQPQSPSRMGTQRPAQTSSQPSSPTRIATQVQQASEKEEIEPQQKEEITSSTVPKLQYETEPVKASPTVTAAAQALETPATSQKLGSDITGADHPASISEQEKRIEGIEGNKVVQEIKREGTTSHAEQKQKEDIFERKKMTISSSGEQIKTAKTRYAPTEAHQKPVMSNGDKVPLHKEIREDISKFVHKLGTELPKQAIGEKPVSILTLAGENKGAFMYLGTESARKDGSIHIHRGYKSNPDDSTEATTDGEGRSRGRRAKDSSSEKDPATKAYINSNTQSINNSILFESSVTEGSPGVQMSLSYNLGAPTKQSGKPGPLETRKAEFNITPAEKHTYQPTIRRRCLRGLLLEPSDSDPDNPEKPRRHGCRYSCGEMSKDKDIGIL